MNAIINGTPKQIAWATNIREAQVINLRMNHERQARLGEQMNEDGAAAWAVAATIVYGEMEALIESELTSRFWIDTRNLEAWEIANKYFGKYEVS
jgi:hypothetical protein